MNKEPVLSHVRLLELLHYEPDTGVFTWRVSPVNSVKVGSTAGAVNSQGYVLIKIGGRSYSAHRLAWFYVHGVWPPNQIDHINRIRTDNRLVNLRLANSQENNKNGSKRRDNTSGITGVRWYKRARKFYAYIGSNGKLLSLGYFDTLEEAAAIRKLSAQLLGFDSNHGEEVNQQKD